MNTLAFVIGLAAVALYLLGYLQKKRKYIILLGIVCSLPIVPFVREKLRKYTWSDTAFSIIGAVSMVTLLLLSIFCLTGSDYNPFIYFRF